MKLHRLSKRTALFIAIAFLWAAAGTAEFSANPFTKLSGTSRAASPKNSCNPCAPKAGNPCNPCSAKASNPCAPKAGNPCNPCNPCAPKAGNPCNPCSAKASNPCNPCAAKAGNPRATQAGNPCNPTTSTAGTGSGGEKIEWGREFKAWDAVTGYVKSHSHGNRLVQTYVYPPEAAKVYKLNAKLARLRKSRGFKAFPVGTRIVQESWSRNELGGPGGSGPVFFMRKEQSGYDEGGGDWRYGFSRDDLTRLGEGHDGKMGFCKDCHARVRPRDFVYATDR